MPYALDNGSFTKFNEKKYFSMLDKASTIHKPLFVILPDVICDAKSTLKLWNKYYNKIKKYDFNLSFACQDNICIDDIPDDVYCCFIGGSNKWKRENAHKFKNVREWLHIGRINNWNSIKWAEWCGADSIDGTGFFRTKRRQYHDFISYFENNKKEQLSLFYNED